MQLVRASQKITRNLSCSKARVGHEEQDEAESEKAVETTGRNSFDQETN